MIEMQEEEVARQQPIHPARPGKKEPEPEEPDKEKEPEEKPGEEKEARMVMTAGQLQKIIEAVRKPMPDERILARQKRTREHNRMLAQDQREMLINRFRSCNHMQMPGSVMTGCASIAWATQSDGKKRGTCQHCGTIFSPVKEECLSEEIWRAYPMLVRLPTHPAGNINNVFQSA